MALLTIEALNKSSPLSGSLPEDASELSLDALLQFTDDFWQYMEAEEISTMWLENFVGESPQERLLMLELLMKSAHARLLGVARLEIALAAPEIMRFLAEKLGDFRSSQAARLLEILLDHPDSAIRRAAACSLNRWNERNPSGASDADDAASAVHFYHAQMATDEWEGQYSLVYAVRSADGQIKFFVTLLDRWDRGIVDCWGCVRYSEQEYDKMLESMAADLADLRQRDIAKHTALTLLTKAMELNAQRKHPLPLEFCVWLHLFENEQFEPDPKVPKFGEDCDICHKPLETGPRRAPWVFGNMVVCNRCCDRTLHCPNCSEQTSLAECLLRCDPGNRHVIKCPGCSHSLEMPT
ncbi:HEAT repeat domain-containing protein [Candidatus Sumerlaeota bacterium]|nr:HEAT repeat domain-containing protein [Candidatus Sumerlaeota bacterium]